MNFKTIGKNISTVRKLLNQTQEEIAIKARSSQALISRLELGMGGTIPLLCDVLNYFASEGLLVHYMFFEPFSPSLVFGKEMNNEFPKFPIDEQLINLINEIRVPERKLNPTDKDRIMYLIDQFLQVKGEG